MKFAIRIGMTIVFVAALPLFAFAVFCIFVWAGLAAIWRDPVKPVEPPGPGPIRDAKPDPQPTQPTPPVVQESSADYGKMAYGRWDKWGTG